MHISDIMSMDHIRPYLKEIPNWEYMDAVKCAAKVSAIQVGRRALEKMKSVMQNHGFYRGMGERYYLPKADAFVYLASHEAAYEGGVGICTIHVESSIRRQGHATRMMTQVCAAADEVDVRLVLSPWPFYLDPSDGLTSQPRSDFGNAMDVQQLNEFFGTFGFVESDHSRRLTRKANNKSGAVSRTA